MPSVSIKAPKLAGVAVFAGLVLIGWAAKATLAQDPVEKPSSSPLPDAPAAGPARFQELPSPNVEAIKPSVATESPAPSNEPPLGLPFPEANLTAPTPKTDPVRSTIPASRSTIEPALVTESDDPEKAAMAFVEQNQKLAETQLKNLKAEEAKLRSRLQKVEGGIRRWESLLGALKQSQGNVVVAVPGNVVGWKQTSGTERETEPQHLEPVTSSPKPILDKR